MTDKHTLVVEALENGTVLDHIPAGQGLMILKHFHLDELGERITVGFNLTSKQNEHKDLIKIENVHFSDEEAARLALFAPEITVNVIEHFRVIKKLNPRLPDTIRDIFPCPNSNCASHGEPVHSILHVKKIGKKTQLKCHYCEKIYPQELVIRPTR